MSVLRPIRSVARDAMRTINAMLAVETRYRRFARISWIGGHPVADVKHTPGGSLYVHLLDLGVGRPLYTGCAYELDETRLLERFLSPAMHVVDVGANVGYMSALAAKQVGPRGRVLAIEPDPGNSTLLAANLSRNGYRNVAIESVAVGAAPGTVTLFRSAWNMGNHRVNAGPAAQTQARDTIAVPMETVDALIVRHRLTPVHFVKMDVEGYEPGVLAGMNGLLERDRPLVLTEFWPFGMRDAGFDPVAFLETFFRMGYDCRTVSNADQPLTTTDAVLKTLPDNASGTYENLLFVPAVHAGSRSSDSGAAVVESF